MRAARRAFLVAFHRAGADRFAGTETAPEEARAGRPRKHSCAAATNAETLAADSSKGCELGGKAAAQPGAAHIALADVRPGACGNSNHRANSPPITLPHESDWFSTWVVPCSLDADGHYTGNRDHDFTSRACSTRSDRSARKPRAAARPCIRSAQSLRTTRRQ